MAYDFSDEAAATNAELAGEMSKLGALSDARIKELLPNRADQDQLNQLIAAVDAATDENDKHAALVQRLGDASVVVKNVVKKYGGSVIKALV
jgi:hypothetical protein